MTRAPHRVSVDGGKYTFVQHADGTIGILRHGQPWAHDVTASNAIGAMMAELDAARVVLAAARELVACMAQEPLTRVYALANLDAPVGLVRAVDHHDRLVDDHTPPSEWAQAAGCRCAGGDYGGHDLDCERRQ